MSASVGIELTGDERCAAALAALEMSPGRLRRLLYGCSPSEAWEAHAAGTHPEDPDGRTRELLRSDAPDAVARRCAAAGVRVFALGSGGYPPALAKDPEAPAVLFVRGDVTALEHPLRVAVVGTRSATAVGLAAAGEIGRTLAAAGVAVVSGLATGVDSAALSGVLEIPVEAPPVAVLGTAHDGRATAGQRTLGGGVAARGSVLSEQAPGSPGARWRFAVRNRIMAALAQVVVVVECHVEGGALHTVHAARQRGVPVAAVPGSVHNFAAAGTNALLAAGAQCVRHGADVIELLGTTTGFSVTVPTRQPASWGAQGRLAADLDPATRRVLRALGPEPIDLQRLVDGSGQALGVVALALEELAARGLAETTRGWWRRVPPSERHR